MRSVANNAKALAYKANTAFVQAKRASNNVCRSVAMLNA